MASELINTAKRIKKAAAEKNTPSRSSPLDKEFRKLSLKYHPDKNNGDDTLQKLLSEVYNEVK